jgi:MSHA biogenesis protein MshM
MYQSFFGLTQAPLGNDSTQLWDNGQLTGLTQQFNWLLQSPGIGLLTAEPGLGKTNYTRTQSTSVWCILYC